MRPAVGEVRRHRARGQLDRDARAPEVEVVIVEGALPDALDGVIGLSLLWQFDLERRDDGGLDSC